MKKLIFFLMALLGLSLSLAAQANVIVVDNPVATGFDPAAMIATLGGFAAGVMVVVGIIKRMFPSLHGIGTQIVSWAVSIAAALLFWWLQAGMFAGMLWYIALLYGFGGGLIANGLADINLVQGIINLFRHK